MATRAYRRDSNGKFAGSGGGSMTTYGKAGGFANAAFRARTASSNQKAAPRKSFALGQTRKAGRAAVRFSRSATGRKAIRAGAGAVAATAVYSATRRSQPSLATALRGGSARGSRLFNTSVNL